MYVTENVKQLTKHCSLPFIQMVIRTAFTTFKANHEEMMK
ncbi:hypothetical protein BDA96_09G030800 [Sorghum bicolor]|uniref:Uncharacterized protein n=2 Tax=Sorghum bicolor TaxID=4558 RepID=A0A921Q7Y3_SORBI|nr:hypothetical protein BDA96_09G030800 [Sorghum bicolor]OQU77328.1 hypothetical protein SORBI_3009G028650 [Sorghum bicolor]